MNRPSQSGLSLIELMVFIIVVSIGIAGILSVMNLVVRHSADPMERKQAMALADSIMEEILLKAYEDPDGLPNVVELGRDSYDDVDDYDGKSNAVFTDLPAALSGYVIGIAVAADTWGGVAVKRVTVTVARGAESISMTGYRASY